MYGDFGDRFVLEDSDEILARLRRAFGQAGLVELATKAEHAAVVPGAYEQLVDSLAQGLDVTDDEARTIIEMFREVLKAEAPAAPAAPQPAVATKSKPTRDRRGVRLNKPHAPSRRT